MESFQKSIAAIVTERLSSPLISTFAISWAFWNSKFFVILLSNNSVTVTYQLIHDHCFPNWFLSLFNGLVAPATLTIFYLYYLPTPLKMVYEQWSRTQKETKDIKQRWEDENLLGAADAQELRQNLRLAQTKVEEFETEIRKLKAELRQSDIKSVETQDVLRTTETEHRKSMDELKNISSIVDEARNTARELEEKLFLSKSETKAASSRATELEQALAAWRAEARPKKMSEPIESILVAVQAGELQTYYEKLSTSQRRVYADQIAHLTKNKYAVSIQDSVGQPMLAITAAGLAYLSSYALIGVTEFEEAIRKLSTEKPKWNEFSKPQSVKELANSFLKPTHQAKRPPETESGDISFAGVMNALDATNKFTESESELLELANKLSKP